MIGAELVRRNDELSLLYEKMRIVDLTLRRGERQYQDRVEDIRILRLEIRNQRCRNHIMGRNRHEADDLRSAVRFSDTVLKQRLRT